MMLLGLDATKLSSTERGLVQKTYEYDEIEKAGNIRNELIDLTIQVPGHKTRPAKSQRLIERLFFLQFFFLACKENLKMRISQRVFKVETCGLQIRAQREQAYQLLWLSHFTNLGRQNNRAIHVSKTFFSAVKLKTYFFSR